MAREQAQAQQKKYPSGASGKHRHPRFPMSAAPEEIEAWDAAAAADGTNRTAWLRALANAEIKKRKGRKT